MGVDSFKRKQVESRQEEIAHILRGERTNRHSSFAVRHISINHSKEQLDGSVALVTLADLSLQSRLQYIRVKLLAVIFHHNHIF